VLKAVGTTCEPADVVQRASGIYVHSYSDLAQCCAKHSASPAEDLGCTVSAHGLNAAIGNVDDHLKNFWMLVRPVGFVSSPAFDLVPDVSGRASTRWPFSKASPARPARK